MNHWLQDQKPSYPQIPFNILDLTLKIVFGGGGYLSTQPQKTKTPTQQNYFCGHLISQLFR